MRTIPSLNGLRTFEVAARHLSFTKAAEELHVTQGAVSHQISRLEKELGIALFTKRANRLALTEAGRQYLTGVSSAFRQLADSTAFLKRGQKSETLVISTLASLASKWLLPRIGAFQAAHPDVEVRVSANLDLVDFGREGVDAAIRYGLGKWGDYHADWLMSDEIFPVCSPRLVSGGALREPSDIASQTLIDTTCTTRDDWRRWLTAVGLQQSIANNPKLTFDLNLMAVQAAIDGLGVAIGRTSYVENDIKAGRLVAPFDTKLPSEAGFYLVTPQETADLPKIRALREWLVDEATT